MFTSIAIRTIIMIAQSLTLSQIHLSLLRLFYFIFYFILSQVKVLPYSRIYV